MVRAREALPAVGPVLPGARGAAGGEGDTAEAFFKWICNFLNGYPSWTVLCVFWGCFVCSSGMLQRKEVSWSGPGAVVFPPLTIFASTSSDFLGHGEHRGRQDVALWVWVNVCVNQVSGRGCPHGRTSLRVCSGLEEPNKLKPYLMVKIFINFSALSVIQGGWCSAVTSPPREGCHIRLTLRTEEYVQLCESGHNRQVCDGDFLHNSSAEEAKAAHRGHAARDLMPLLQPASETFRWLLTLVLSSNGNEESSLIA